MEISMRVRIFSSCYDFIVILKICLPLLQAYFPRHVVLRICPIVNVNPHRCNPLAVDRMQRYTRNIVRNRLDVRSKVTSVYDYCCLVLHPRKQPAVRSMKLNVRSSQQRLGTAVHHRNPVAVPRG